MEKAIAFIQYFGFGTAQIINGVLLYLLVSKANSNFGRYRILMILFSIFAMFYSAVEFITFPVMFCKGRSLCVCSNGPLKLYKSIGIPLTSVYCGCFGMCIALLALHFHYRYIAVFKPEKLYYYNGKRITITILPCFVIFIIWTGTVYYFMYPDYEKQLHYHDVLLKYFDADSFEVSFVSMLYKSSDSELGPGHWNPSQLVACAIFSCIMGTCFFTILVCGYQALRQMKNSGTYMSSKTKELNRQLFMTLGMQTLLPVLTMYIPVGSFIIFPLLGIELGVNANKTGAFIGLYPALDPLIAILLIKDFRNYVFCRKKIRSVFSTTTGMSIVEKSASTHPKT